jgi:hypothetical protein
VRLRHSVGCRLKEFQAQKSEIESNEALLAAELGEQKQVEKLSRSTALQRLLGSKIEQGSNRLKSAEAALRRSLNEAFKSFGQAHTELAVMARALEHRGYPTARKNDPTKCDETLGSETPPNDFFGIFLVTFCNHRRLQ